MFQQYEQRGELWVHPEYAAILDANDLAEFDALMTTGGDRALDKKGLAAWRQRIMLELQTPCGLRQFYLKRYRNSPLGERVRLALGGYSSSAEIEWRWLDELRELGIKVPTLVAYGARRADPVSSLLLTEALPGCSLEHWIPQALQRGSLDRCRTSLLSRRLLELVRALHTAALVHRDLYAAHVFVHERGADLELYLIDLQRMIRTGWRRRRWLIKDLAALNYSLPSPGVSRSVRLRWLRDYLGGARLSREGRRMARAIHAKTQRIARHSRKHGLG